MKECIRRKSGGNVEYRNKNLCKVPIEITLEEINEAVNKLKNKKSQGPDNINNELIKYGEYINYLRR